MEDVIRGITRGGKEWIPQFVSNHNDEKCIGCGRCFKACGRDVLSLYVPTEEEEEEDSRRVMEIVSPDGCIGCEACGKVCMKKCFTFATAKINRA